MKIKLNKYIIFILFAFLMTAEKTNPDNGVGYNFSSGQNGLFRIGEYGYPANPMNDRAKGFSIQGKVKNAVLNYGNFIDWDYNPSGGWGEYTYLPNVSFMAGVPGYVTTAEYTWIIEEDFEFENIYASLDAYNAWAESKDEYTNAPNRFSGIVYNIADDRGDLGLQRVEAGDLGSLRYKCTIRDEDNDLDYLDEESCVAALNETDVSGEWVFKESLDKFAEFADYEWAIDNNKIYIYMKNNAKNPQLRTSSIGLVYPWAFRPKLQNRFDEYDRYDYGDDNEEWTDDDYYTFYGATTSESWFSRWDPKTNSDWHAATSSSLNTHNTQFTSGDLFGDTDFTGGDDSYPVLAHSNYVSTWPSKINLETFEIETFWPGWYADEYYGSDPDLWEAAEIDEILCGSNPSRTNPECWKELPGRFISDSDIYMEFDDRWAHRGNMIDANIEYIQTGYPLGLTIQSMVHSYGVSYAEDIMFVTVKVRNESGDYDYAFKNDKNGNKEYLVDTDGNYISGQGLVMPDGTKLNASKGFNYEKMALGFYMDADVLMGNLEGYDQSLHTNADDFMEYYDCKNADIVNSPEWSPYTEGCPIVDGDTLRISMAMIYDYDGESGGVTGFSNAPGSGGGDLGIVATQLLDSPYATTAVDLNQDGFDDIYPGEKLKMTDWHWFDWLNRPGVVTREGNSSYAGAPGVPQARNKEEIQYKLLSGDNSNLSDNEKEWFFHSSNPELDLDGEINPHFDSLEGLKDTEFFIDGDDGLDCVLLMSCSPFDLEVGEEVDFSFCVIFGEDRPDLLRNAEFAQIMYNAHYQGYTPPRKPKVAATANHGQVKIHWNNLAERSRDVITNYTDFEGYKIYKSMDGGSTWGDATDKIYDGDNTFAGWLPFQQFDLSAVQDSSFCVKGFIERCYINGIVQHENYQASQSEEACESLTGVWRDFYDENEDDIWNPGESYNCLDNEKRRISVKGIDPEASWLTLGNDSGFDSIIPCVCSSPDITSKEACENNLSIWECNYYNDGEITYNYTFVDNNVQDGYEYTYSITSYDTGVMSDKIIINNDGDGWLADTVSVPDPNGWGKINSFQYLENSKGTTVYDDNFVKIVPGYTPQHDWSLISVSPNPFIIHSDYETNEYQLKWMISGLPISCAIKIFTVTGELINEFRHTDNLSGFEYWDLRNKNNQEIAPGLYFYTVEDLTPNSKLEPFVGKFVIIR